MCLLKKKWKKYFLDPKKYVNKKIKEVKSYSRYLRIKKLNSQFY